MKIEKLYSKHLFQLFNIDNSNEELSLEIKTVSSSELKNALDKIADFITEDIKKKKSEKIEEEKEFNKKINNFLLKKNLIKEIVHDNIDEILTEIENNNINNNYKRLKTNFTKLKKNLNKSNKNHNLKNIISEITQIINKSNELIELLYLDNALYSYVRAFENFKKDFIPEKNLQFIFIYCNIENIANKEVNDKIYKELKKIVKVNNKFDKFELLLYFTEKVKNFSLSLLQTILSFLYLKNIKHRRSLKFIGNGKSSVSYTISQMLFYQFFDLDQHKRDNFSIYSFENKKSHITPQKIIKWGKSPSSIKDRISRTKYVISKDFIPLIILDRNKIKNFEYFFKNTIASEYFELRKTLNEAREKFGYYEFSDKDLFKEVKNFIWKKKFKENSENIKEFKHKYYLFYYFNIWNELKLFPDFLNSFKDIKDKDDSFKKVLSKLKNRLENIPLYQILLFNILLTSDLYKNLGFTDPKQITGKYKDEKTFQNKFEEIKSNRKRFVSLVDEVYKKSEELYNGIYELAKNINTHLAGDEIGFLTLRIYNREKIKSIYNTDLKDYFSNYLETIGEYSENKNGKKKGNENGEGLEKEMKFLEIMVLDNGTKGVLQSGIDTLYEIKDGFLSKSKTTISDSINTELEDINGKIKSKRDIGEVIFESFYSLTTHKTGRQTIKSAAGYGLIIFMQKIKKLNGFFTFSTSYDNKTFGFAKYINKNYNDLLKTFENNFLHGTYYNIVFPVSNIKKKDSNKTQNEAILNDSIKFSFESIFTGTNILYKELLKIKKSDKKEFTPSILAIDVENNDIILDYLLKNTELRINPSFDGKNKNIICFDISDFEEDASDLIRFLAELQLNIEGINSIVIYNDKKQIGKKILEILKIFSDLGYNLWDNNNAVLFYYYNDEDDFINSYLLLGENNTQFIEYNNNLSKPHFNKIPIDFENQEKYDESRTFPEQIPLFITEGGEHKQMLFLHLLLETELNTTIFEHNVALILNKKIDIV